MLLGLIFCLIGVTFAWDDGYISIISQKSDYDEKWVEALMDSIVQQDIEMFELENPNMKGKYIKWQVNVGPFLSVPHKNKKLGTWQLWPLIEEFHEILQKYPHKKWFLILDAYSNVKMAKLTFFLNSQNAEVSAFYGLGVFDEFETERHNYKEMPEEFDEILYPESSTGIVLSKKLILELHKALLEHKDSLPRISMDPGFELARFIYRFTEVESMTSLPNLFCIKDQGKHCAVYYTAPMYSCPYKMQLPDEIFVSIKSYSEFHTTRLNILYYTWEWVFNELKTSEIVSDIKDPDYRTIASTVPNTPTGHCEKTLQIMKNFLKRGIKHRWLLITDDDTLLNVATFTAPLACYDYKQPFILGDRFGYNPKDKESFDYPAGGAGRVTLEDKNKSFRMVLSHAAVTKIVDKCKCPAPDTPDDKFIGACAWNNDIPVMHIPGFHYWRPSDYPMESLTKIQAISFHKFTDIDPLDVHRTFLDQHVFKDLGDNEPKNRLPIFWDNFKMNMTNLPPGLEFWKEFWSRRSLKYQNGGRLFNKEAPFIQGKTIIQVEVEPEIFYKDVFGKIHEKENQSTKKIKATSKNEL